MTGGRISSRISAHKALRSVRQGESWREVACGGDDRSMSTGSSRKIRRASGPKFTKTDPRGRIKRLDKADGNSFHGIEDPLVKEVAEITLKMSRSATI